MKKLSWNNIQLDAFVSYWIIKELSLIDHKQYCRTFIDTKKGSILSLFQINFSLKVHRKYVENIDI